MSETHPSSPEPSALSEQARVALSHHESLEAALGAVDTSPIRRRFSRLASMMLLIGLSLFALAFTWISPLSALWLPLAAGAALVGHVLFIWTMLISRFDPRLQGESAPKGQRVHLLLHVWAVLTWLVLLLGLAEILSFSPTNSRLLMFGAPTLSALFVLFRAFQLKQASDSTTSLFTRLYFVGALLLASSGLGTMLGLSSALVLVVGLPMTLGVLCLWFGWRLRFQDTATTTF